jgi:hypothetical protein
VGQNLEVGPDLGDQMADHQAVEHAERMVRDHDDRSRRRNRPEPDGIVLDLEPEMADRRLPDALARPRPAPVVEMDAPQAGLAGQALDGPDGDPAQSRIGR